MTSHAVKQDRIFHDKETEYRSRLQRKRSCGRLKSYSSATDKRAWSTNVNQRRRHILELLSNYETGLGNYIPFPDLLKALTSIKDGEQEKLFDDAIYALERVDSIVNENEELSALADCLSKAGRDLKKENECLKNEIKRLKKLLEDCSEANDKLKNENDGLRGKNGKPPKDRQPNNRFKPGEKKSEPKKKPIGENERPSETDEQTKLDADEETPELDNRYAPEVAKKPKKPAEQTPEDENEQTLRSSKQLPDNRGEKIPPETAREPGKDKQKLSPPQSDPDVAPESDEKRPSEMTDPYEADKNKPKVWGKKDDKRPIEDDDMYDKRPSQDAVMKERRPSNDIELDEEKPSKCDEIEKEKPQNDDDIVEEKPSKSDEREKKEPLEDTEMDEKIPPKEEKMDEKRPSKDVSSSSPDKKSKMTPSQSTRLINTQTLCINVGSPETDKQKPPKKAEKSEADKAKKNESGRSDGKESPEDDCQELDEKNSQTPSDGTTLINTQTLKINISMPKTDCPPRISDKGKQSDLEIEEQGSSSPEDDQQKPSEKEAIKSKSKPSDKETGKPTTKPLEPSETSKSLPESDDTVDD